jgi:hypothetical protein
MSHLRKAKIDPREREREPELSDGKFTMRITVPISLTVRMSTLGIHPQSVALRAFREAIKAKEEKRKLASLKERDPRLGLRELRRRTKKVQRLLGE